jgi:RNase H-fold protein (predicted Holliday junction resolvase)
MPSGLHNLFHSDYVEWNFEQQTEQRIAKLKALLHQPADRPISTPDEDWKTMAALCQN